MEYTIDDYLEQFEEWGERTSPVNPTSLKEFLEKDSFEYRDKLTVTQIQQLEKEWLDFSAKFLFFLDNPTTLSKLVKKVVTEYDKRTLPF
jgi:hypothetical protein